VPNLEGGIALVTIRNAGARTCRLTGRPRVRLVKNGPAAARDAKRAAQAAPTLADLASSALTSDEQQVTTTETTGGQEDSKGP
jgi:hypothetical protein